MLRKRLITVLTFNDGVLFRTKVFNPDYRYTLNFVDAWSVDEIVVLDVTRPGKGNRENFLKIVEQFAERCFVPLAAGGWVKDMDDFKKLLRAGADKIVINSQAVRNPKFIKEAAQSYGAQCVVVSIDCKKDDKGEYKVFIDQGQTPTSLNPVEWAKKAEKLGAGEIMVTAIEKDGSLEGYDNEL